MRESGSTVLVELLAEALGDWRDLPPGCWAREAMAVSHARWEEAIEVVSAAGCRPELLHRLREEHPHAGHKPDYDATLRRVFTEAEAFAWGESVAGLSPAQWILDEGCPDVRGAGDAWIEAKTIEPSDDDRSKWEVARARARTPLFVTRIEPVVPPHPGLMRKFVDGYANAVGKLGRQPSGTLTVFFDLVEADAGASEETIWRQLADWAAQTAAESGHRIVVCWNYGWQIPRIDTARAVARDPSE